MTIEYKNNWYEKELSKQLYTELTCPAIELSCSKYTNLDNKYIYRSRVELDNIL